MAYTNFIPTIWAEAIQRELDRACVFKAGCNQAYTGEVKERGDQVRILGIGAPTIHTITKENAGKSSESITGPETISDSSITLKVDQIRYFNYMVGDIDKAQAVNGLMDALSKETAETMASAVDAYIGAFATADNVSKLYDSAKTIGDGTSSTVTCLDAIDAALQKLYENDVSRNTDLELIVSPRFYTKFRKEYRTEDTDNSKLLETGAVARYNNILIKLSNNVYKTTTSATGDTDNMMLRTRRAVAFVNPLTKTEAYRPEAKFADAVKGYTLFGGVVARPKEIININVIPG